MRRELASLEDRSFDLAVVGAGIHGACIAMEAAQRGLSVALVEKGDLGSATSHNSLKIAHGGIRYLQHLDFLRVRQSVKERKYWLRAAPHVVRPMEFWMPVSGFGTRGALALWSAIRVHGLIGFDRNVDVVHQLPSGRIVGSRTVRETLGGMWGQQVPMAAAWWDGQMVDADRLVLLVAQAAAQSGAVVANYVTATEIEVGARPSQGANVSALNVRDELSGKELTVRASNVALAAGPWTSKLARTLLGHGDIGQQDHIRNMNIVVPRQLESPAIGILSSRESDAVVGTSNRLFFMTPWRECSIIGTTHEPYNGDPDGFRVDSSEVREFVDEIAEACPGVSLSLDDVRYVYAGLTPAEGSGRSRQSEVVDHGATSGPTGLYSIYGVKYTTARLVAERFVSGLRNRITSVKQSRSARELLPGAPTNRTLQSITDEIASRGLAENEATDLTIAYGEEYAKVLELMSGSGGVAVLEARARLAVREELCLHLNDFIFHRTDWVPRGLMSGNIAERIGNVLAEELGWSEEVLDAEVYSTKHLLAASPIGASDGPRRVQSGEFGA